MLNRVRLLRRQQTTTVIETAEDEATLNAVNSAIEDVLATRKWEFDLRHDGELSLRAVLDDCTASAILGTLQPQLRRTTGLTTPDIRGDYAIRLRVDGLTDYANTSFVVTSSGDITSGTTATLKIATASKEVWTLLDAELHYGEYMLPDTVKEVVRVSHQENDVSLFQADPVLRYDELFPNQSDAGPPKTVAVGGYDIGTFETGVTTTEPKLRLAVWPIPDDDYVLSYSYYYRHPELSAATDTLIGVPPAVVNDIVLQAASTVMMTWDQNFAASHFTDLSREQATAKYLAHGGSDARRRPIGSFEGRSSNVVLERGFPNRVIGP